MAEDPFIASPMAMKHRSPCTVSRNHATITCFGIKGPLEMTDDLTGGARSIDVSQDMSCGTDWSLDEVVCRTGHTKWAELSV
jgi:hypothetical protein